MWGHKREPGDYCLCMSAVLFIARTFHGSFFFMDGVRYALSKLRKPQLKQIHNGQDSFGKSISFQVLLTTEEDRNESIFSSYHPDSQKPLSRHCHQSDFDCNQYYSCMYNSSHLTLFYPHTESLGMRPFCGLIKVNGE